MVADEAADSGRKAPSLGATLRGVAVIQAVLLLIGGLAADFGVLCTWVINAVATYWLVALPMLVFRRSRLTNFDIGFLRWGSLILLGIYLSFGATIHEWVHRLR